MSNNGHRMTKWMDMVDRRLHRLEWRREGGQQWGSISSAWSYYDGGWHHTGELFNEASGILPMSATTSSPGVIFQEPGVYDCKLSVVSWGSDLTSVELRAPTLTTGSQWSASEALGGTVKLSTALDVAVRANGEVLGVTHTGSSDYEATMTAHWICPVVVEYDSGG